ncbi:glycosyltransferase family 4 protein [Anabaena sp. UHCC 0399]|uniref:glycosyltransferase family 4 protein n=1 Tax=Anabaena sp. UHCC 0399 TaxID=3110238 RepID=UPI002B2184FB|nr:glycosyltransferase family 4 protein [Anabaena sp. UHCC 0399]MEA5567045.1 glycosyltransferase family 4 protein [Anabaena sp. UHCC 0399]
MAEALAREVDSLTLLTSGSILPSQISSVDLVEWYGVPCSFKIVHLPIYIFLNKCFFEDWRYLRFDICASLYTRFKSPNIVFTRSLDAGYICVKLKLKTIIETHISADSRELRKIVNISRDPNLLGIVTVNEYLKNTYIKTGIPATKILVWSDAIDVDKITIKVPSKQLSREELGLPPLRKIVTYCGHFYEYKGVSYVIEAAKYLPDILFCLVGGWPNDIERCQKQAEGLKNIYFAGFVPNKEVYKYLAASDFLLLPNSGRFEQAYTTSPLKLFEYMAAQRPIIASDIPALQGVIRHKDNAFLVEPDSATAIADALKILEKNYILSNQIAENARQYVNNFTWSHRAKDILNFFLKE